LSNSTDVSRPDRLSSAEIASIVQAAGLQGLLIPLELYNGLFKMFSVAVRKNRYVILPVDFEEAWKVCCLAVLGIHRFQKTQPLSFPPQQTVKRADDTHEFCKASSPFHPYLALIKVNRQTGSWDILW
jgi:26S proteasome regulatory subunit T3